MSMDAFTPDATSEAPLAVAKQVQRGTETMTLIFVALAEIVVGLALLVVPSSVGQFLLDQELTGVAIPVARVTGIVLVSLGIACWPGPSLRGMLTYSGAVTLYLSYIGLAGHFAGLLLWPAVVVHAVLTVMLARVWLLRP